LILQGTITERTIEAGDDKKIIYGPYYQWTRKISQKTVTVNLSPSQVKLYKKPSITIRKWRNHKRNDPLINENPRSLNGRRIKTKTKTKSTA